jgi:uncharacterized membrane protein
MILLLLGLSLWMGAHLMKRVLPKQRGGLGKAGKPFVAITILFGLALMILGYRDAETDTLYVLPFWVWYLNNAMMFASLILLDAGRVNGVVRTKVRHPMLAGVIVWSAAHLLVNGDLPSILLFGGLGLWAVCEILIINRSEGAWIKPEAGRLINDGKLAVVALVLYAVIVAIHGWLGYTVFVMV